MRVPPGMLSDNLGLRISIERSVAAGGYSRLAAASGFTRFRRVVHLVVNAQTESRRDWIRLPEPPGTLDTLVSASTVTLNRYNFETVELLRLGLERDLVELREARCRRPELAAADCGDVAAHLIEVSFAGHPDPAERAYLSALPTALRLGEEEVERTVAAAGRILAASPEFQALLADLASLSP